MKMHEAMRNVGYTVTPRPMAFIDAWFDEMMVNESAAPRAEQ